MFEKERQRRLRETEFVGDRVCGRQSSCETECQERFCVRQSVRGRQRAQTVLNQAHHHGARERGAGERETSFERGESCVREKSLRERGVA